MDYKLILKDIRNKKFEKMYFLHGEEAYFIDMICDEIMQHALEEHERDFNQTILYGKDAELLSLISELKAYPMMSERRLVVLKEAQDFRNLEGLESYVDQPLDTTIFVICHKYKAFDARKKILKSFAKNGLVFKSDKVREYQLADWIQNYVKSIGFGMNSKASMLLAEFLGTDLGRIVKELEKLAILLPVGTTIDETHVELNIGISKDYNVFEFVNAISARNTEKAFKIIQYFEYNPKAVDLTVIIANLFKFFSQIMRIHFLPNKSREAVAQTIGVHPFVAGELLQAKNQYDPRKIAAAIELLHRFDLKAKGVGNASASQAELLKELTYQILH